MAQAITAAIPLQAPTLPRVLEELLGQIGKLTSAALRLGISGVGGSVMLHGAVGHYLTDASERGIYWEAVLTVLISA